ncbi:hypothetical protein D3C87_719970 [compost metagenome]
MAIQIKKGDTFLCRKNMVRDGETIYTKNQMYRSNTDHGIVANCGKQYFGFNHKTLQVHFIKN